METKKCLAGYDVSSSSLCDVYMPQGPCVPFILSVPHDGVVVPDVPEPLLRTRGSTLRDRHVGAVVRDLLLSCPVHAVIGQTRRRYVDYNRAVIEVEGLDGCAYEDDRLASLYEAYHVALTRLIDRVRTEYGTSSVTLLDLHGFSFQPEYAPEGGYDLILGTKNRRTVHGEIDRKLAALLIAKGYQVFLPEETPTNMDQADVYDAGYITQLYGSLGVSAIQIEIAVKYRKKSGIELGKKLAFDLADTLRRL
jgi:N-formylglutamate amidohydrolase